MSWVNWIRKAQPNAEERAGRAGLEVNASWARAVLEQPGRPPRRLPLDEPREELPLALSLEKKVPEVGRAGLALCRRLPHLSVLEFLPHLGQPRDWQAGRHHLTAGDALSLVWQKIHATLGPVGGVYVALPAYLTPAQVTLAQKSAEKAKLPWRGSATLPLALAASVAGGRGAVLVADADDFALTLTLVQRADGLARVLSTVTLPRLGVRAWKDRLLDALADRCVRACRRDPRDSAPAEQALYEQIDDALDRVAQGQRVELTVRTASWYQELAQRPDDFDGYCAPLVKKAVAAARDLTADTPPAALWLTAAVCRLPGLVRALSDHSTHRTSVQQLPADLPAKALVTLGRRWQRNELPPGHLDLTAPLPEPQPERETPRLPMPPSART